MNGFFLGIEPIGGAEGVALETHGETEKVSPVCSTTAQSHRAWYNRLRLAVDRSKNQAKAYIQTIP